MKRLGIIGGAGPLASALLYETVIRESYRQTGTHPEIHLINFPFTRALTQEEGREHEERVKSELRYCLKLLRERDVAKAVVACNTLHLYLRHLPDANLCLSIPEVVLRKALELGDRRLLILATQNSRRSGLYEHPEVECIYPNQHGQKLVDVIIDRILLGKIERQDADQLSDLLHEIYQHTPYDGVVLGCTDLPVLHAAYPLHSPKCIYDSIKIPARGLL
jgi:aspartate racemase